MKGQVGTNSPAEWHQPGGVLEMARIFSRILVDQYEADLEGRQSTQNSEVSQFGTDRGKAYVNSTVMMLANLVSLKFC